MWIDDCRWNCYSLTLQRKITYDEIVRKLHLIERWQANFRQTYDAAILSFKKMVMLFEKKQYERKLTNMSEGVATFDLRVILFILSNICCTYKKRRGKCKEREMGYRWKHLALKITKSLENWIYCMNYLKTNVSILLKGNDFQRKGTQWIDLHSCYSRSPIFLLVEENKKES